ncbi:recombinase family protein [Fuscibacter oryzae]|nr:recombinase family protein [Fuscibacter oryzae]
MSLRAIAAELNARGIRTRRGGQWGVSNAGALIGRLARRM